MFKINFPYRVRDDFSSFLNIFVMKTHILASSRIKKMFETFEIICNKFLLRIPGIPFLLTC